jgi:hypothetical protein
MMRRTCLVLTVVAAGLVAAGPAVTSTPRAAATPAIYHHPANLITQTAAGWTSGNWSGYAGTTPPGTATSVEGYWKVPTVTATPGNTYSATWLGIDGFGNSDLIQTGTQQEWLSGHATYGVWWEILPASETPITSFTVKPGNLMFAEIQKMAGDSWQIEIEDVTTGKSFTTTQAYTGPAETAEWIQEAPTVGGTLSTLAHYSRTYFDKAGLDGHLVAFTAANRGVMKRGPVQVSTPSKPDSDQDGFAVAYGSKTPPPNKS